MWQPEVFKSHRRSVNTINRMVRRVLLAVTVTLGTANHAMVKQHRSINEVILVHLRAVVIAVLRIQDAIEVGNVTMIIAEVVGTATVIPGVVSQVTVQVLVLGVTIPRQLVRSVG